MLGFFSRSCDLPDESDEPHSAIRTYLAQFVQPDISDRCAFRAWQEIVSIDQRLAQKHQELERQRLEMTSRFFKRLQTLPHARRSLNVQRLAQLINGSLWDLLGRAPGMKRSELDAHLDTTAQLIYHGLFSGDGKGSKGSRYRHFFKVNGRRDYDRIQSSSCLGRFSRP